MVFTPIIRLICAKFATWILKLFKCSTISRRIVIVLACISNLFTWPLQLIDLLLVTIRGKWDEVCESEPDWSDSVECVKYVWNTDQDEYLNH